jgi:hypothetical protein
VIKIPKVPLTPESKVQQSSDYPRLTLDYGDRALIVCIEPEPVCEFRHVLEAPEIGPDGKVLKEERKTQKGEPYEATVKEFIGQHLCFGDFNVMSEKGADPDNCPTCAAAKENDAVYAAKSHYAMHVIKYSLQPGGWILRDPFNAECIAWVFSPTRLNALIDLAVEWGDLRQHDLKLGPCENKKYQKYDINVAKDAQWLVSEERKQFVAQTYANNQAEDLSALIARRITKAQALEDIQKVLERDAQLTNPGANTAVPDLTTLQKGRSENAVNEPAKSEDPLDVTAVQEVQASSEVNEPTKPKEKMDLKDILKDL